MATDIGIRYTLTVQDSASAPISTVSKAIASLNQQMEYTATASAAFVSAMGRANVAIVKTKASTIAMEKASAANRAEFVKLNRTTNSTADAFLKYSESMFLARRASEQVGTASSTAASSLTATGAALQSANTGMKTLSTTATSAGKGLSGFALAVARVAQFAALYAAVNQIKEFLTTGAEFQHTMQGILAITQATDRQFKELKSTTLELSKTTIFSANEIADATRELALAGFAAGDLMKMMPAIVDVAMAGQMGIAQAAEITAAAARQMQIPLEDLARVGDLLVYAANTSAVSVEDLGVSLKYAGPIAAGFGVSLERLSAMLGTLGNAGIKGSTAGTQLAFAFQKVDKVFKTYQGTAVENVKQQAEMEGRTLDFIDALKVLDAAGASSSEALEIFGLRGGRAAMAMLNMGIENVDKYIDAMKKAQGFSKKTAEMMMDDVSSVWNKFGSALGAYRQELFQDNAQWMQDVLEGWANWFNEFNDLTEVELDRNLSLWENMRAGISTASLFSWFSPQTAQDTLAKRLNELQTQAATLREQIDTKSTKGGGKFVFPIPMEYGEAGHGVLYTLDEANKQLRLYEAQITNVKGSLAAYDEEQRLAEEGATELSEANKELTAQAERLGMSLDELNEKLAKLADEARRIGKSDIELLQMDRDDLLEEFEGVQAAIADINKIYNYKILEAQKAHVKDMTDLEATYADDLASFGLSETDKIEYEHMKRVKAAKDLHDEKVKVAGLTTEQVMAIDKSLTKALSDEDARYLKEKNDYNDKMLADFNNTTDKMVADWSSTLDKMTASANKSFMTPAQKIQAEYDAAAQSIDAIEQGAIEHGQWTEELEAQIAVARLAILKKFNSDMFDLDVEAFEAQAARGKAELEAEKNQIDAIDALYDAAFGHRKALILREHETRKTEIMMNIQDEEARANAIAALNAATQKALADANKDTAEKAESEWDTFGSNIKSGTESLFKDVLRGGVEDWEDFADKITDIFADALAEMAAKAAVSGITNALFGTAATATSAAVPGLLAGGGAGALLGGAALGVGGGLLLANALGLGKKSQKYRVSGTLGMSAKGISGSFQGALGSELNSYIETLSDRTVEAVESIPYLVMKNVASEFSGTITAGGYGEFEKALSIARGKISQQWNAMMKRAMTITYEAMLYGMEDIREADVRKTVSGLVSAGSYEEVGKYFSKLTSFIDELQNQIDPNRIESVAYQIEKINDAYYEQLKVAEELGVSLDLVTSAKMAGLTEAIGGYEGYLNSDKFLAGIQGINEGISSYYAGMGDIDQTMQDIDDITSMTIDDLAAADEGLASVINILRGWAEIDLPSTQQDKKVYIDKLRAMFSDASTTFEDFYAVFLDIYENSNLLMTPGAWSRGRLLSWYMSTSGALAFLDQMMGELKGAETNLEEYTQLTNDILTTIQDNAVNLMKAFSETKIDESLLAFRDDLISINEILDSFANFSVGIDPALISTIVEFRDTLLTDFFAPIQDIIDQAEMSDIEYATMKLDIWLSEQVKALDTISEALSADEYAGYLEKINLAYQYQLSDLMEDTVTSIEDSISSIADAWSDFVQDAILELAPSQSMETYQNLFENLLATAATGGEQAVNDLLSFVKSEYLPFFQAYTGGQGSVDYATIYSDVMSNIQAMLSSSYGGVSLFPMAASGGIFNTPYIGGEAGTEMAIPLTRKSNVLSNIGLDPDAIGASVAKYLAPILLNASNKGNVSIKIGSKEIVSVIAEEGPKSSDFIKSVRRIAG